VGQTTFSAVQGCARIYHESSYVCDVAGGIPFGAGVASIADVDRFYGTMWDIASRLPGHFA
jgi:hypothetical protein